MNYRLPTMPKDVNIGDRCYICHDGYIKGWMKISNIHEKDDFTCATTGVHWKKGVYVSRTGKFHYLKEPILSLEYVLLDNEIFQFLKHTLLFSNEHQ